MSITVGGTRVGTPGYMDPMVSQTLQVAPSSDVYAFGVMLLAIVLGLPAFDGKRRPPALAMLVKRKSFEPQFRAEFSQKQAKVLFNLGQRATQQDVADRPSMYLILVALSELIGQEIPVTLVAHYDDDPLDDIAINVLCVSECILCMDEPRGALFACGHALCCRYCSGQVNGLCPVCGQPSEPLRYFDEGMGLGDFVE